MLKINVMEPSKNLSALSGDEPVVLRGSAAHAYRILERLVELRREVNLFILDDMPDVFASPDKNHVLTDIEGAILSMEFYLDVCVCEQANPKDEH